MRRPGLRLPPSLPRQLRRPGSRLRHRDWGVGPSGMGSAVFRMVTPRPPWAKATKRVTACEPARPQSARAIDRAQAAATSMARWAPQTTERPCPQRTGPAQLTTVRPWPRQVTDLPQVRTGRPQPAPVTDPPQVTTGRPQLAQLTTVRPWPPRVTGPAQVTTGRPCPTRTGPAQVTTGRPWSAQVTQPAQVTEPAQVTSARPWPTQVTTVRARSVRAPEPVRELAMAWLRSQRANRCRGRSRSGSGLRGSLPPRWLRWRRPPLALSPQRPAPQEVRRPPPHHDLLLYPASLRQPLATTPRGYPPVLLSTVH